ncbi:MULTISPECIES: hypothetical protein [unclassified Streptomyces]|jgi:hypothetical protein|uniref:YCII-related domain-containing protein n=2 Tax=unclassified Streptomyces TaxID=2593676 RepID=A0AB39SI00_9ACTN
MAVHLGRKSACKLAAKKLSIARRIGVAPHLRGSMCGETCPDVFELSDGRFAVIGAERTAKVQEEHPELRELDAREIIVVVDRWTLIYAKPFIPDH